MSTNMKLQAAVFDLDGVITHTRDLHFSSWKKLFDSFLLTIGVDDSPFEEEDYLMFVDGMPRYDGVRCFLKSRNIELPEGEPTDKAWKESDGLVTTVCALGNNKDKLFNEELEKKGAQVYESTVEIIKDLIKRGIVVSVGSSSKNCLPILKKTGLLDLFSAVVDGVTLEKEHLKGKPQPDMFLRALELSCESKGIKIPPEKAMLVEDAQSGVQAGRNGHFGLVIGIDRGKNRDALLKGGAHLVINDFAEVTVAQLDSWFGES